MRIIEICNYPPEDSRDSEVQDEKSKNIGKEDVTMLCAIERTNQADRKAIIAPFEIPPPLSPSEKEDTHGRQLANSIPWYKIFESSEPLESLLIQVRLEDESLSGHLFWELLEHEELCKEFRLGNVYVSRYRSGIIREGRQTLREELPTALNVLVVVARPRAEADIPHRLVTRSIIDVIAKLPSQSSYTVTVEVVRPGTFEALQEHLTSRPDGYFQYVHLDVHGSENASGSVFLDFLADSGGMDFKRIKRNPVSPEAVAKELDAHAVEYAILNACRSAKQGQISASIAQTLVDSGLWGCIAMSYDVISRSVEIFTQVFYEALLLQRVSFECAARYGRRALKQQPKRLSKFGQPIEVDDSLVPLVFMNYTMKLQIRYQLQPQISLPSDQSNPPGFLFGREADILRIESALLIGKRPLLITGEAGVGKTYLIRQIREWWKETRLIGDGLILKMSRSDLWAGEEMCEIIHSFLGKEGPYPGRNVTLAELKKRRLLVVLDCLESMREVDRITARERHKKLFHFLQATSGGKCLIVLISRARETWLSGSVWTEPISGILVAHAVQLFDSMVAGYRVLSTFPPPAERTSEDRNYTELLVKLVDCHPLAVQQIAWNYCRTGKQPRSFLMDLLAGAPLEVADHALGTNEGYRSIREIRGLIENARPKHMLDGPDPTTFAGFWRRFPAAQTFSISFFFAKAAQRSLGLSGPQGVRSSIDFINLIRQIDPDLAPVQGDELESMLRNISFSAYGPDIYSQIDTWYLMMDDLNLEDIGDYPGRNIAELGCKRFLDTFRPTLYLQDFDPEHQISHMERDLYLQVNPLLPILLRADDVYTAQIFDYQRMVREGFFLYYTYRTKRFPHKHQWYNPAWDAIREELHFDFFNYAGAVVMSMRTPGLTNIQQSMVLKMLVCLHRGTLRDPSRFKIVATLIEAMVSILVMQEAELVKEIEQNAPSAVRNSVRSFGRGVASILGLSGSIEQGTDHQPNLTRTRTAKEKELLEMSPEFWLFTKRTYIISFCPILIQHYHRVNSLHQFQYLQLAEKTYTAFMQAGPPQHMASEWAFMQRNQEEALKQCRLSSSPNDIDPEVWFKHRTEYHQWLTAHYGVETVPATQVDIYSLPVENMGASSQVIRMFRIIPKVRSAIDEGRMAEARKLIDDALIEEINVMSNDENNKATLLRFRSEVDEKEGNWEDALKHYEEALTMEALVAEAQGGEMKPPAVQEYRRKHREMLMSKARGAEG